MIFQRKSRLKKLLSFLKKYDIILTGWKINVTILLQKYYKTIKFMETLQKLLINKNTCDKNYSNK